MPVETVSDNGVRAVDVRPTVSQPVNMAAPAPAVVAAWPYDLVFDAPTAHSRSTVDGAAVPLAAPQPAEDRIAVCAHCSSPIVHERSSVNGVVLHCAAGHETRLELQSTPARMTVTEERVQFRMGNRVMPLPGTGAALRSGAAIYDAAVVVSVEPFILVSEATDMLWTEQHSENYQVVGQVSLETLGRCVARLARSYLELRATT